MSRTLHELRREILAKLEPKIMIANLSGGGGSETSNRFIVGRSGDRVVLHNWHKVTGTPYVVIDIATGKHLAVSGLEDKSPPAPPIMLSVEDGLNLAVWLANICDPGLEKFHAMSEAINRS